jgi:AraC-like DNA-binding protein
MGSWPEKRIVECRNTPGSIPASRFEVGPFRVSGKAPVPSSAALCGRQPVVTVARRVGYATPSAFIAAIVRETGLTPGGYFGRSEG